MGAHRRKGFTVIEIVVAASLAALLGLAVASVLVSSSKVSSATATKAQAEQQIRDVQQVLVRFLRSSSPMHDCLSPLPSTPAQSCLVPVPRTSIFDAEPTPSKLVFYARTDDATTSPFAAPDKVTVETVVTGDGAVVLEVRVEKSTVTYTQDWAGTGTPTVVRRLLLREPSPNPVPATPFSFLDAAGQTAETGDDVAVVVFNPKVVATVDGADRVFGSPLFIALPLRRFGA